MRKGRVLSLGILIVLLTTSCASQFKEVDRRIDRNQTTERANADQILQLLQREESDFIALEDKVNSELVALGDKVNSLGATTDGQYQVLREELRWLGRNLVASYADGREAFDQSTNGLMDEIKKIEKIEQEIEVSETALVRGDDPGLSASIEIHVALYEPPDLSSSIKSIDSTKEGVRVALVKTPTSPADPSIDRIRRILAQAKRNNPRANIELEVGDNQWYQFEVPR